MRLSNPGDFDILTYLNDNGRNVAANICRGLDLSRGYVNSELPKLEDYGLVRKIGPSPNSGLYEITDRGRAALELRHEYATETNIDFDQRIDEYLDTHDV